MSEFQSLLGKKIKCKIQSRPLINGTAQRSSMTMFRHERVTFMENLIQVLRSNVSVSFCGIPVSGPLWFVLPVFLVIVCLFIWSLIWIYSDAEKRQKNGLLGVVFALVAVWPWSLLWWVWLRPPRLTTPSPLNTSSISKPSS